MTPNKPDAANPAMALGLTIGGQCRVADLGRSASSIADLGRSASSIQNSKSKIQNSKFPHLACSRRVKQLAVSILQYHVVLGMMAGGRSTRSSCTP